MQADNITSVSIVFFFICAPSSSGTITPLGISTYLYTPQGTEVKVSIRGEELTSSQIMLINLDITSAYPNATFLSHSTTNYNCHSYAWHNASTSNIYWMDRPDAYMSDGSYYSVAYQNCAVGDKIYYQGEHSGIVYFRPAGPLNLSSVTVISKWGMGPLMRHQLNDCPYTASTATISVWRR